MKSSHNASAATSVARAFLKACGGGFCVGVAASSAVALVPILSHKMAGELHSLSAIIHEADGKNPVAFLLAAGAVSLTFAHQDECSISDSWKKSKAGFCVGAVSGAGVVAYFLEKSYG